MISLYKSSEEPLVDHCDHCTGSVMLALRIITSCKQDYITLKQKQCENNLQQDLDSIFLRLIIVAGISPGLTVCSGNIPYSPSRWFVNTGMCFGFGTVSPVQRANQQLQVRSFKEICVLRSWRLGRARACCSRLRQWIEAAEYHTTLCRCAQVTHTYFLM